MQGILIFLTYLALFGIGLARPFVLALGYVWVDLFSPQAVYPDIFGSVPVSLIMGAAAFFMLFLLNAKDIRRLSGTALLLITFGGWATLTLLWAEVPEFAWSKWDWAVKSVLFAAVLPFFFQSRAQIEALVLTIVFSTAGIIVPVGLKTFLSGGGYGFDDIVPFVVTGPVLGEGITLSLVAVMTIPLILFASQHSVILAPWSRARLLACAGLVTCYIVAALGTFARTGLVSLVTLGTLLLWQSKHRLFAGILMLLIGSCLLPVVGPEWVARMETISTTEVSAAGRIDAWTWALQYVQEHPFGGGLEAYRVNAPFMRAISGGEVTNAKATHSIYFEALSETGFAGLAIWFAIVVAFYRNMYRLWRQTRDTSGLEWLGNLVKMSATSMTVFMVGGSFLSVAFIPSFYYLIVLCICLREYYRNWVPEGSGEVTLDPESMRIRAQAKANPRPATSTPA